MLHFGSEFLQVCFLTRAPKGCLFGFFSEDLALLATCRFPRMEPEQWVFALLVVALEATSLVQILYLAWSNHESLMAGFGSVVSKGKAFFERNSRKGSSQASEDEAAMLEREVLEGKLFFLRLFCQFSLALAHLILLLYLYRLARVSRMLNFLEAPGAWLLLVAAILMTLPLYTSAVFSKSTLNYWYGFLTLLFRWLF